MNKQFVSMSGYIRSALSDVQHRALSLRGPPRRGSVRGAIADSPARLGMHLMHS